MPGCDPKFNLFYHLPEVMINDERVPSHEAYRVRIHGVEDVDTPLTEHVYRAMIGLRMLFGDEICSKIMGQVPDTPKI
jgi:hypothetical protein